MSYQDTTWRRKLEKALSQLSTRPIPKIQEKRWQSKSITKRTWKTHKKSEIYNARSGSWKTVNTRTLWSFLRVWKAPNIYIWCKSTLDRSRWKDTGIARQTINSVIIKQRKSSGRLPVLLSICMIIALHIGILSWKMFIWRKMGKSNLSTLDSALKPPARNHSTSFVEHLLTWLRKSYNVKDTSESRPTFGHLEFCYIIYWLENPPTPQQHRYNCLTRSSMML